MPKSIALVTLHGMGETHIDYHADLYAALGKRTKSVWDKVSFRSVYYQGILQGQQAQVFNRMREHIDWMKLRRFLLYGFSDAASLEYKKEEDNSSYYQTQMEILKALDDVYADAGGVPIPVVVIAQSLGCQVISSYIWDARRVPPPEAGIWKKPLGDGVVPGSPRDRFRRMDTLVRLYTTGCNIPIFVAGHENIRAIDPPNASFAWYNFFDEDDVLGWPLAPLSPSYEALVRDFSINAGGSFFGGVVKSWNPLSHGEYWNDGQVLDHLSATLQSLA